MAQKLSPQCGPTVKELGDRIVEDASELVKVMGKAGVDWDSPISKFIKVPKGTVDVAKAREDIINAAARFHPAPGHHPSDQRGCLGRLALQSRFAHPLWPH